MPVTLTFILALDTGAPDWVDRHSTVNRLWLALLVRHRVVSRWRQTRCRSL